MPRSTASFISYDLRPAKQTERRILIDILSAIGDSEIRIRDYRYIGMGGNQFYDFLLMHRYLGIRNMISLEHDPEMHCRASFNVPYKFISVQQKTADEFLAEDLFSCRSVIWLDYDGGISPSVFQDIQSLSTKMKLQDFVFITLAGAPPKSIQKSSDKEKLIWFQDSFGDLAANLQQKDMEKSAFAGSVHKVLFSGLKNAFNYRRDGRFIPLMRINYADSLPMVTLGGGLFSENKADAVRSQVFAALPFLELDDGSPYRIRPLNLTEKERGLFDRAATQPRKVSKERNNLLKIGFKDSDIDYYRDLMRYFPRYVETIV